ncbi:MAG: 50S ribosomal protein L32 [Candidatus Omnitrophota bacterium]
MPNPKRKHSKSRRDKRRAKCNIKMGSLSTCPECKMPKVPHRVCPSCGHYKGKLVLKMQKEEKEGKKK